MKFLGKIRVGAAALGLAMCFSSAQALYVIDYIDFSSGCGRMPITAL